jgi:hypothetical protein
MADEEPIKELPAQLPLADHFRNSRVQEAENIRQEYIKSTGRLPLLRPKPPAPTDIQPNNLDQ